MTITKTKAEDPDDRSFQGDREAAIARLWRLTQLACEQLPAAKLNRSCYYVAMHLDAANGFMNKLMDQVLDEIAGEPANGSPR